MAYSDAVTRLGLYGGSRRQYTSFSAIASAAITGAFTEAQIVAGGETITITLTADTWVAAGATFNAQRQNIIDGLDSAQVEAAGWNAEVRDKEVVTAVARTSDTVVTITLTAAPDYAVTADETITATIPATALTGGVELTGVPTVAVTAEAESAAPSGGWAFLAYYDRYRQRKISREEEEKTVAEHIGELEGTDAEIAQLLHRDDEKLRQDKEIAELESMVAESFRNEEIKAAKAYSEKVAKAYIRAVQQGNYSAYRALEREMEQAREEDEFLLLAMTILE